MSKLITGFVLGAAIASAWWGLAAYGPGPHQQHLFSLALACTLGSIIGVWGLFVYGVRKD